MKKSIFLLVFVCLVDLSFTSRISAQTPAPTVSSPIYYCQNSVADPLSATVSPGGTLNWYGTSATGGTASSVAPTPSTAVVGLISYYVSQTIAGVEGNRSKIDVNVVADNGSKILLLRCDASQIVAPSNRFNAVYFDWTNTPGVPNQYTYSYTVDGGIPVLGSKNNGTNLQVDGLSQGQSVTLTVWHTTYPCDRSSVTCFVACNTFITPTFTQIPPVCEAMAPAPSLPLISNEGVTGTWTPAVVNTTTPGTTAYTFTPNPTTFPCANPQVMNITVLAKESPVFNSIPSTVCEGSSILTLPLTSDNAIPISGTWTPSTVNSAILGTLTYTFTPNVGQCVVATPTTATITVLPNAVNPSFAPIAPICVGNIAPVLNSVSPIGITGIWNPLVINTATVGTNSYTFTPDPNQCAVPQTLSVTILPKTVTDFIQIAPFCAGSTAPVLANTSPNGISGTWSPVAVDNMASGTYIFTPNTNECATVQSMSITINQPANPGFSDFSLCSGTLAPTLDNISPNGITGTWTPSSVDNLNNGTYTFTPDPGQCAAQQTINVTVMPSNTLVDFTYTLTDAFEDNQKITISATAIGGDYLYQLDDGPFQSNNVFEYVSSGLHSVTVMDQSGCSMPITKTGILVVNFPKYFTPNNDGYNDNWNILELNNQPFAYIRIFDRYGKFLKQISPNGPGWNGTHNGHFLPADDYWFVIHYLENNVVKEFKSHFSLKR